MRHGTVRSGFCLGGGRKIRNDGRLASETLLTCINARFRRDGSRRREVMATMKVAQVPKAGADFQIVERDIPEPGPGQVRIRVQACGVCHSDSFTKEGTYPGITYPRVPGHEVAGVRCT